MFSRNLVLYLAVLFLSVAAVVLLLQAGGRHVAGDIAAQTATSAQATVVVTAQDVTKTAQPMQWLGGLHEPLSVLLLQIIVVFTAARLMGVLFTRMGQPAVIGEIVAGIMLGPSLLGMLSRPTLEFLFPDSSMGTLKLFAQVGVLLFMFVVGMDVDARHFRNKARSVIAISHSSIVLPFILGVMLAMFIYHSLAPAGVSFTAFALFIGIAMSITAFPVLARIIQERGLANTQLGQNAITCAAVDDVTAWCLLALVVAIVKSNALGAVLVTVGLAAGFFCVMFFALRPLAERLIERRYADGENNKTLVTGMLVFAFASAAFTAVIGIHALFGAFLAGVIIPAHSRFSAFLHDKVATFSSFLMPLFFAVTGMRTQIGLLNDWASWLTCLAIIAVAITGKLCGAMFAARWSGQGWRESFAIGALMNTRGLVELVVLNIGYDLGILGPRIFSMLVIMALVTTFMTGPLLNWAGVRKPQPAD